MCCVILKNKKKCLFPIDIYSILLSLILWNIYILCYYTALLTYPCISCWKCCAKYSNFDILMGYGGSILSFTIFLSFRYIVQPKRSKYDIL